MTVVPFPKPIADAILGPILAPSLTPAQRRLAVEGEIARVLPELDRIGADMPAYRLRACAVALMMARDKEFDQQEPVARKRVVWWQRWMK